MQHSSAFCRAQAALQAQRATETILTNVRSIATAAAAAWRAEALLAEQREKRHLVRAVVEDQVSETPDRGLAQGG